MLRVVADLIQSFETKSSDLQIVVCGHFVIERPPHPLLADQLRSNSPATKDKAAKLLALRDFSAMRKTLHIDCHVAQSTQTRSCPTHSHGLSSSMSATDADGASSYNFCRAVSTRVPLGPLFSSLRFKNERYVCHTTAKTPENANRKCVGTRVKFSAVTAGQNLAELTTLSGTAETIR
jgi:hypothetical protein